MSQRRFRPVDRRPGNWPVSAGLGTVSISTSLGTVASAALEPRSPSSPPRSRPAGGRQWVQPICEIIHLKAYIRWLTPLVKKGVFTYKRMKQRCLTSKSLNCINHYLGVTASIVYSTSKLQNSHSPASPRRETLRAGRKQGSQSVIPPPSPLRASGACRSLGLSTGLAPADPTFPPERTPPRSLCLSPTVTVHPTSSCCS